MLLCVPDSSISSACEAIFRSATDWPVAIGHTSGATPLSALRAAEEAGAGVFSLHPLQTIPDGETSLAGTPCAVSAGSPETQTTADDLASALGMVPFSVPEDSRAAYHAAAAIASNFLVAIEEAAAGLLESAEIPNGRELLSPLVLQTARNWTERGADALTGPISRGDRETVERHRVAIATLGDTALENAYSSLVVLTERISPRRAPSRERSPA